MNEPLTALTAKEIAEISLSQKPLSVHGIDNDSLLTFDTIHRVEKIILMHHNGQVCIKEVPTGIDTLYLLISRESTAATTSDNALIIANVFDEKDCVILKDTKCGKEYDLIPELSEANLGKFIKPGIITLYNFLKTPEYFGSRIEIDLVILQNGFIRIDLININIPAKTLTVFKTEGDEIALELDKSDFDIKSEMVETFSDLYHGAVYYCPEVATLLAPKADKVILEDGQVALMIRFFYSDNGIFKSWKA